MSVFDVRDKAGMEEPCIICIGGIVGELIISFTCMLEYIQSTPELSTFRFRPDMIEKFIKEVLVPEYPGVVCDVKLTASLTELNDGEEPDINEAVSILMDAQNIRNFGLQFLMQWRKDLFLQDELIKTVLHAICSVVLEQTEEPKAELGGDDVVSKAEHMRTNIVPAMNAVRDVVDPLERVVPDDLWPVPAYRDMLFVK